MDRSAFIRDVAALALGKRLPEGVYLHVEALPHVARDLQMAVETARALAKLDPLAFQVVKFAVQRFKLSLLAYPKFFEDPFPCLLASWIVDLETRAVTYRAYAPDGNPPILHRKEVMLPPGHPRLTEFTELTTAAERLGLFDDAKLIGTKRVWDARLRRVGARLDGHRLVAFDGGSEGRPRTTPMPGIETRFEDGPILRHRTALQRYSLSTPMQALFRHGYLDGHLTVFDYGCGRGDDVRILKQLGIDAGGWDPHFAPSNEKHPSDVVNIGFVINVIEDTRQRSEALEDAYVLARKVLVVAALIGGRTAYERHRLFRDGVLTTRGTFQKYFSQQELREYLETTLGREPIAVAPGTFFVFRDDTEEQKFLAARQTRARREVLLPKVERERAGRPERPRRPSRWEQHRELLETFWERCLQLGRLPKETEFERFPELRGALGSPTTVLYKLREERGEASLEAARRARMDDLLVYLALNLFERRKSFRRLPEALQRDISVFWGSYVAAQSEATKLLFSLGNVAVIHQACTVAVEDELGYLDGDHSLQFHSSLAPRLPAVLRVYVGCAARLYGEVDAADVVKIHIQSGKVSLMMYDGFVEKPLPRLLERVKINLRTQSVQFFDYDQDAPAQFLYNKSRYISPEFERYDDQRSFDEALASLGLDMGGYGLPACDLQEALSKRSLSIQGFQLVPTRAK